MKNKRFDTVITCLDFYMNWSNSGHKEPELFKTIPDTLDLISNLEIKLPTLKNECTSKQDLIDYEELILTLKMANRILREKYKILKAKYVGEEDRMPPKSDPQILK